MMPVNNDEPMEVSLNFRLSPYNSCNCCKNCLQFQKTKFACVVEPLRPDVVDEVADIFEAVPEINSYYTLEATIIKRMSRSREAIFQELFNNIKIGYRTASQLQQHIKSHLRQNSISQKIL